MLYASDDLSIQYRKDLKRARTIDTRSRDVLLFNTGTSRPSTGARMTTRGVDRTVLSGSVTSNSLSQLMQNRYWFGNVDLLLQEIRRISVAAGVKFLDGVGFTGAHQLYSPHVSFGVCLESLPVQ